ncbi:MAG: alpha/beta fold hydrolase [Planctomycetes bacterium]|nr:alpha/beta fold hydrolase [Planctomycetota bacterium]
MRMLLWPAALLAVALLIGPPLAAQDPPARPRRALCPACAGNMYTMDVGVCTACGGNTSSGAFKLCNTCALAKGVCMHCGASLDAAAAGPAAPQGPVEVGFTTEDGFALKATFTPAISGLVKGAVVLLHMLNRTRSDWREVGTNLSRAGFEVLAIDLRGHGESLYREGQAAPWKDFTKEEFQAMPRDLAAARKYLEARPELAGKAWLLVGASIGGNVAAAYAASDPSVDGVALLSPGLDYRGVTTEDALRKYGKRPIFLASSSEDEYSSQTVKTLAGLVEGPKTVKAYQHAGHGTKMFGNEDDQPGDLTHALVAWCTEVAATVGGR